MLRLFAVCFSILFAVTAPAQLIAGPMLGPVELRTAKIWIEVAPAVKTLQLRVTTAGKPVQALAYKGALGNAFNPVQFEIGGLEPNSTYQYHFIMDGKRVNGGAFTTKDLWQWRKSAPDFTFLAGSCTYVNEPRFDRPGTPYGKDSSIFKTMANEQAAFMLWLGDNWYTREVDYSSEWGLWYRAQHDRRQAVLQPFLKALPHYAVWDDHDYGPNDIGASFPLKETSRRVFQSYWANPSYGEEGRGVYTQFSYSDVDFFLLDDRWWRSADGLADSVDGKPNTNKQFLGRQQLQWLKNALTFSAATFKIIVVGTQVLNPVLHNESMRAFSAEYNELTEFLLTNDIKGVLFLTGDHHHSEVIKQQRPGTYPLYDVTVSPLTSGLRAFAGPEINNPYRVMGFDTAQNYGRVRCSGGKGNRMLTVEFLAANGTKAGAWQVHENDLK